MGSGPSDATAGSGPAFKVPWCSATPASWNPVRNVLVSPAGGILARMRGESHETRPAAVAPPLVQILRAALISQMIASSGRAGRGAGVAG